MQKGFVSAAVQVIIGVALVSLLVIAVSLDTEVVDNRKSADRISGQASLQKVVHRPSQENKYSETDPEESDESELDILEEQAQDSSQLSSHESNEIAAEVLDIPPAPNELRETVPESSNIVLSQSADLQPESKAFPEAREITARSLVGLVCYFKSKDETLTDVIAHQGEIFFLGSGVIVSPEGYILTAQHVIDPLWNIESLDEVLNDAQIRIRKSLEFDYCDVGPPATDNLPTKEQIRESNPSIQVGNPFLYKANLFFKPDTGGFSDTEKSGIDFAILRIVGPSSDCANLGSCKMPSKFPYSPVSDVVLESGELISFGSPYEGTYSGKEMKLKGIVGWPVEYQPGDVYFQGDTTTFEWYAPNGSRGGRSGSPIFYNGYVIGVHHAARAIDYRIAHAVGTPVIMRILREQGLEYVIAED